MNAPDQAQPALDHLVIATDSLEAGCEYLHSRLGVTLDAGGRHDGYGTHNRLLSVGGGTYLELIAPDPDQPPPARPRPFGLDDPAMRERIAVRPRLVRYMVRTPDIEATAKAMGFDPGPVRSMRRGNLEWRLTSGTYPDFALDNPLPALIDWGEHPSPGLTMPPRGVVLSRLHVLASAETLACLAPLGHDRRLNLREQPIEMLAAEFITPRGWVILD